MARQISGKDFGALALSFCPRCIYYYAKLHGRAPSEADIQGYFKISPPTVHQMILSLEKQRYIERSPGQARSIRLLLTREQLPNLD